MVYLDNAASTMPAPEAAEAHARAMTALWGNPSSAHALGAAATRALDEARAEVARLVRAEPSEIVFTSGGTEANALGVLGVTAPARARHVVATAIEHPAVLRNVERLARTGFSLTLVPPGPDGCVSADDVLAAVRDETALVAAMLVNNELGTVQPVSQIAAGLRGAGRRAHLHVDAVQAVGFLPVDVRTLGADSLALSGHKIHAPKGTGALWRRKGARIAPLWEGGGQEQGLRSGTENVAGWVALGRAAALCREGLDAPVAARRDRLEALIFAALPEARPTARGPRAPHIASIIVPGLPAEPVLHAMEARGVYASAGSACASRARGPSHVLKAMGVSEGDAVLRLSLSRYTTDDEVRIAAGVLIDAVAEIRNALPARRARS